MPSSPRAGGDRDPSRELRGELRADIDVEAPADLFNGLASYRRLISDVTIDDAGYARVIDTLLQSSWNPSGTGET
jgi:hypothetical protein